MKKRSKKFRVAREGQTTDGRTIKRSWIADMAETYNRETYGARVNLEHIRGIIPDSPFRAYGDVLSLEAREEDGKLELYAEIQPTEDLVRLVASGQKIYSSVEVQENFAGTGRAYLVGLAVTDSPASLGCEVLQFAAQNPEANPFRARKQSEGNLFTAAEEVSLEFVDVDDAAEGLGAKLFARVQELLRRKGKTDDARFADQAQAIEAVAQAAADAADAAAAAAPAADLAAFREEFGAYKAAQAAKFDEIERRFNSTQDPTQTQRPPATGGDGAQHTDC